MSNANKTPEPKRQSEIDRLRRLEAEILTLRAQLEKRERELAEKDREIDGLKSELAHARSTSATSSKPPSSDIVKPRRAASSGKRKIGGQAGHPAHVREPFKPEEINGGEKNYTLDRCPDCAGPLKHFEGVQNVVQQVEIRQYPVDITEHRGHFYWCAKCGKQHDAPVPPEIEKAGLCGPRLTALIAYLKGACHASFSTIRKFLRDVAGITVSRGMLAKVVGKVSESLAEPYAELRGLLPAQDKVNVDETGHKENRQRMWTWCFRAELFVLFKIDESRGSQVLIEMLGAEFDGVLGCDYFSAYRKYMRVCDISVQFCLAHLIRDIKFLITLPDAATRAYGERLLTGLRGLFGAIHQGGKSMPAELALARERILLAARTNVPASREALNMAGRFELHGAAYFRFITTPGIEPTNNLAEQAIRFVVLDRMVTQGTRSEKGRRWCERIWTAIATCSLSAVSVFDFIESAVRASFNGLKSPSLLPATS